MLDHRSEPGSYMAPELADGAKAELLPVEVIVRFRDALKYGDHRNPKGDR